MEELLYRLKILKKSNLITEIQYNQLNEFINYVNNIGYNKNLDMLITHIAMVMNRINENKEIEKIDNETIQSFKLCNCYKQAEEILYYLQNNIMNQKINDNEKWYVIAHLIAIMEGE